MSALPYGIMRVGFRKVPQVQTNTERMQAWLATRPVVFANTTFPRREARNQYDPSPFDEVVNFADRRGV